MNVFEAIQSRYSVRRYAPRDVEEEKIERLMDAARLAPSANNRQEWRFVIVKDPSTRQALMTAAANQKFVGEAPVVIACCAVTDNHLMRCGQLCYPIDVSIAIDHITLQAVEEGLGTCWIGAFYEDQVKQILDIPEDVRVVELLTLGYPADEPKEKNRLSLETIVMRERWEG